MSENKQNMPVENIGYVHRTLCSVLTEMRETHRWGNYSYLGGLIEEAQTYGNRMEAQLEDTAVYKDMKKDYKKMKKKHKKMKKEVAAHKKEQAND